MLRVLKSELAVRDGIAYLDGGPFSGLAFDLDNVSDAVRGPSTTSRFLVSLSGPWRATAMASLKEILRRSG